MSGKIVNLIRGKQVFDFSFLGTSGTQVITLHRALPTIPFYYYWLGVRVHNVSIQTGSFLLRLYETLPSSQDPQQFTSTTVAMSQTINSGTTVGLVAPSSTTNLGPYVKVVLEVAQGTGGNRLFAELSAVLVGRIP